MTSPGALLGVYRTLELIGKGGYSEVWSAWDTRLNRMIALKIIPRDQAPPESVVHFTREAIIITRLEHPHVLPLYDFGEMETYYYLVMRYVTGGSLSSRIHNKPMPPAEVLRLMQPISAALDYIHTHQIVHRDVKPGNILLDAQNLPYLTDFGLAKSLSEDTQQMNSGSGTLYFMSPEQLNNMAISIKSDQYSFGITLFQLFTGALPLNGEYVFALRQANFGEKLPDVRQFNPELPAGLNGILAELTAVKPEDRPENLTAVVARIAALVGENPPAPIPSLAVALDSEAYRRQEVVSLLDRALPKWATDSYALSLTHFSLLDLLISEMPDLLTPESRSLMLRGALEANHHLELWWGLSTEAERRRACWNALVEHAGQDQADDALWLRVLKQVAKSDWREGFPARILALISERLLPLSEFTPIALTVLEQALPRNAAWEVAPSDPKADVLDDRLRQLAKQRDPLAKRAATLIGVAHRTKAATQLPATYGAHEPLLTIYEHAGTLPPGYSRQERWRMRLLLGARQLTQQPLQAVRDYLWSALGAGLSLALMVYVSYRKLTLVATVPLLNAIGQGIMFGALYGAGIWIARRLSHKLVVAPRWLRLGLAIVAGGLTVALTFWLYQKLVYDDVIEPVVSVLAGFCYVSGFALSVRLSARMQILAGSAGVIGAFLIAWFAYLQSDYSLRPPFFFDENAPEITVALALGAGLLLASVVTAQSWLLPFSTRRRSARTGERFGINDDGRSAPTSQTDTRSPR